MKKTTIFSWGYYGWGEHTPLLKELVDTVEENRGYEPPIFVDIRIRRSVRASGFIGNAFERLMGQTRHRWMQSLGNNYIVTRTGPFIQIADPTAAGELLDLAFASARQKQRVLFFCGCQWPCCEGVIACHRTEVADLLRQYARKRGEKVEIVEWPGGVSKEIDLNVTTDVFNSVRRGRRTVPLGANIDLAELGSLPWGSIVTLRSAREELHRIVGPVIWHTDQWCLPILEADAEGLVEFKTEAERLRESFGLEPLST